MIIYSPLPSNILCAPELNYFSYIDKTRSLYLDSRTGPGRHRIPHCFPSEPAALFTVVEGSLHVDRSAPSCPWPTWPKCHGSQRHENIRAKYSSMNLHTMHSHPAARLHASSKRIRANSSLKRRDRSEIWAWNAGVATSTRRAYLPYRPVGRRRHGPGATPIRVGCPRMPPDRRFPTVCPIANRLPRIGWITRTIPRIGCK